MEYAETMGLSMSTATASDAEILGGDKTETELLVSVNSSLIWKKKNVALRNIKIKQGSDKSYRSNILVSNYILNKKCTVSFFQIYIKNKFF